MTFPGEACCSHKHDRPSPSEPTGAGSHQGSSSGRRNAPVRGPQRRAMRNGGARNRRPATCHARSRAYELPELTRPAAAPTDWWTRHDRRCPRRARVGWRSRPPRRRHREERAERGAPLNSSASSVVTRRTPTGLPRGRVAGAVLVPDSQAITTIRTMARLRPTTYRFD